MMVPKDHHYPMKMKMKSPQIINYIINLNNYKNIQKSMLKNMSTCRSHNFLLIAQKHKPSEFLERSSRVLHFLFEDLLEASKNAN